MKRFPIIPMLLLSLFATALKSTLTIAGEADPILTVDSGGHSFTGQSTAAGGHLSQRRHCGQNPASART